MDKNHDGKASRLGNSLAAVCAALAGDSAITPSDKLSHHLLMTIERRRATPDWLIQQRSRGHVRPRIRRILYWALTELLWMDGASTPAVVNVAVDYVKQRYPGGEASFVNGMLRGLLRSLEQAPLAALLSDAPAYIAGDIPELLWERWRRAFGDAEAKRLCQVLQLKADVILRRRSWPSPRTAPSPELQPVEAPEWAAWAELYRPTKELASLDDLMATGDYYIQDKATLLAPTLLAPQPGDCLGDFCCAPGGKSRVLLELLRGTGHLLCADKSEKKLPMVQQNLQGFDNMELIAADAALYDFGSERFDGILLDVPCSNTGVIRRKPDVRWNFTEEKLQELLVLQQAILQNAARHLKPGGRLVYSTCSIEHEENHQQLQTFLERNPDFRLVSEQTLLPTDDHDGAFAVLLKKNH